MSYKLIFAAAVVLAFGAGAAMNTTTGRQADGAAETAAAATTGASPGSMLPICEGDDRAGRKLTCIVDGDTGWEHGRKWRYTDIDAPEMPEHAGCSAEVRKAYASRDRLRALMGSGYTINWSGKRGHYGRALVTITIADGRDAGRVLMDEGLAQSWPNHGNIWCGR